MYCSSCGAATPPNLSYCNRCGAKAVGAGRQSELAPGALLNSITAVFVFGLAAVVGLMALMKEGVGFNPVILAAAVLSFVLLVAVEAVLVGLLLSVRRRAGGAEAGVRPDGRATKGLGEAQARPLPEPAPSAIEHTTRAFDPAYVERKPK
ncbi:MAG TPA: hypothetical protein VF668_12015 [Pyrinomonadaceae bacterium]|jgi:hypothetical protein